MSWVVTFLRQWLAAINEHDVTALAGFGLLDSRRQLLTLVAGEADGTLDDELWRTPAAWKAVVRDGSVAEWRVYADNKPVYEILVARRK